MQKDCNLLLPAVGTCISEALDHHPMWSWGWVEGENTEAKQNPVPFTPNGPLVWAAQDPYLSYKNPRESPNQNLQKEELGNIKAPVLKQTKAKETMIPGFLAPLLGGLLTGAIVYMGYWMQVNLCTGGMLRLIYTPFLSDCSGNLETYKPVLVTAHSHAAVAPSLFLTHECRHPSLLTVAASRGSCSSQVPARSLYWADSLTTVQALKEAL